MLKRFNMKTGNIGENLGQAPRQSRGGNAVETYNRRPEVGTMRKSDPICEYGSLAEMSRPSDESRKVTALNRHGHDLSDREKERGLMKRFILKTGNIGENLGHAPRQSRSENHLNSARTSNNRRLLETMMCSGPHGDMWKLAEMIGSAAFGPLVTERPLEDLPSGVDTESAESVAVSPHVGQGDTDNFYRRSSGLLAQVRLQTGNIGETLVQGTRKSRGGNAVETYNRRPL